MIRLGDECLRIWEATDLETGCARLAAMQSPALPLMRAAADGRLQLVLMHTCETPWPTSALKRTSGRPTVLVVGDDPAAGEGEALGPEGWACARRLRYWTAAVVAHGAGGEPEHYREVVRAAELVDRVALIETSSTKAQAWARFLSCRRTLLIVPPIGGMHPVRTVLQ